MGKRRWSKVWLYAFTAFIIIWPLYQIIHMTHEKTEKPNATKLLYQVALFQMEMLGSFLHDAGQSGNTGELNELKQVLYSANFAHEHLVMAMGEDQLTYLPSLNQLLQFIIRLQIGGQRPLKPDEAQTLQEASKQFAEMYNAYEKMLSSGNEIVGSQNSRLMQADKAILELIKKRLLTP
jgi:hypothetical protein